MSNKARTEKPPEQMTPEEWAEVTRAELLALLQAYRAKWGDEIVGPFISRMERETGTQGFHLIKHKFAIEYSIEEHEPVNARSVDFYGIKLPSGYVREGDLYVFKLHQQPKRRLQMPKAYEAMRDKFAQGGGEKGQPEVQRGAEQGGGDLQRQAPEAPREEQGAVTLSEPGTVIPWKRKLPKDADVYERLRTKTVHLTPEIAVHESYLGTVVEDLKDFPKENIWDFSDENTSVLARHMNKIDRRRGIGSDNTLQATRMLEDAYGNRVRKAIEERESIPVRMFDDWESGLEDATKAGYIREGDLYVFKPETPPDKGEVL